MYPVRLDTLLKEATILVVLLQRLVEKKLVE